MKLPREIQTATFTLPRHAHARLALARRSTLFWCAVSLPLAILLLAGAYYDSRLIIIALAIIFILYPTLLFIAWWSIVSRPSAVAAMFPQRVTLNEDDELTVDYFPLPSHPEGRTPRQWVILPPQIAESQIWSNYLIITTTDGASLLIPLSALPDITADIPEILRRTAVSH